jgi:Ca2+-binding EF-hand superfamily protein
MSDLAAIGGFSPSSFAMQGGRGMGPPDPSKVADTLFSQLDSSGKGSVSVDDVTAALKKAGDTNAVSDAKSFVKTFDADGNGSVTKSEVVDGLSKLQQQAEANFAKFRLSSRTGNDQSVNSTSSSQGDSTGLKALFDSLLSQQSGAASGTGSSGQSDGSNTTSASQTTTTAQTDASSSTDAITLKVLRLLAEAYGAAQASSSTSSVSVQA